MGGTITRLVWGEGGGARAARRAAVRLERGRGARRGAEGPWTTQVAGTLLKRILPCSLLPALREQGGLPRLHALQACILAVLPEPSLCVASADPLSSLLSALLLMDRGAAARLWPGLLGALADMMGGGNPRRAILAI